MNQDVFLSILAMDAYSRGEDGTFRWSDAPGTQLGTATIGQSYSDGPASFYAVSYAWNGQDVISFRGTDEAFPNVDSLGDLMAGWVSGAGVIGPQAQAAIDFFEQVTGQSIYGGTASNTILTGHSLGGGLAGMIGGLTGTQATLFDTMPYAASALALAIFENLRLGALDADSVINDGGPYVALPTSHSLTSFSVEGEVLFLARALSPAAAAIVYGSLGGPGFGSLFSDFTAAVEGSVGHPPLSTHGWWQANPLAVVDLHSQALQTLLLYARGNETWTPAAVQLIDAWFNDEIGEAIGLADGDPLTDDGTGLAAPADQMLRMIAYSAIDDGERPWGDTGIVVLFDDAGDLGQALTLGGSSILDQTTGALAQILTQFAGGLAYKKVMQDNGPNGGDVPITGVLSLEGQVLSVSFSDTDWSWSGSGGAGGQPPAEIVGRDTFVTAVVEGTNGDFSAAQDKMAWLWGASSTDIIDRIEMDLSGADLAVTLTGSETGVTLHVASDGDNTISGSVHNDFIVAGDGQDYVDGGAGADLFVGAGGADWLIGGEGRDVLVGGDGEDTADFSYVTGGGVFTLAGVQGQGTAGGLQIDVSQTDIDRVFGVEQILLTDGADTLVVSGGLDDFDFPVELDAGSQPGLASDTLDLTALDEGVRFDFGEINDTGLTLSGFETLYFGNGDDQVRHNVVNSVIDLGDGNDTLVDAAAGTEVWGGAGADTFHLHDNVRIMDASADDRVSFAGLFDLTGGLRSVDSASPYAMHMSYLVGYGLNADGDLVIHDFVRGRDMFIRDYESELEGGVNTAGIHVAEYDIGVYRILEPKPSHMSHLATWELALGHFLKANIGVSAWNGVDPLVLDLDGDGLELTGLSDRSPVFDMDGDGFGERGGWVRPDDGFLVLDANSDGQVNDVSEMFGGQGASGFGELATHDLNLDGVIDASDAVFADLQVWRDLDQDRVVDAGELASLSELGITSIDLGSSSSTDEIAGNAVLATGAFTRADGTGGLIADVGFRVDNQRTEFLGDDTISAAAALLPDLRGYGTLTDLRVAMTLDPALQTIVTNVLPGLATLDLAAMREAVLPLLTAWADASPVSGATPPGGHQDIPVLTAMVDGARVVVDYAYQATDPGTGQTNWILASTGAVIQDPFSLVGDPPSGQDGQQWQALAGEWIDFFERYLGEPLPLDAAPVDGQGAAAGLQGVIAGFWQTADLLAVRLAMQGPLSDYFEGIVYDAETDTFQATTDRELIPVFEAIFEEVDAMASGGLERLEEWRDVLDIVIGDYRQEDGVLNTNGFLFANIVAAYEAVGLTLDIVDVAGALGLPEDLVVAGGPTLTGSDDADLFYLSAGDQTATGGLGPDTYVVGRGFGSDVIVDLEPALSIHSQDVVRFADIASTEVTARREGVDLIISVTGTSDELRIVNHFDGRLPEVGGGGDLSDSTGVDLIVFADGVQWTPFDVARAVSRPDSSDQTLIGTDTVDWMDGGAGDDFLSGGSDSDVYVYGRGYGHDVVDDANGHVLLGGPDFLSFVDGIEIGDLNFSRTGASDDLVITVDGEVGSITLVNQFSATYTSVFGVYWIDQIEGFLFEDGGSLSWEDVAELLLQQASTSGDDSIYGFSLEDRLDGGAGDDFLSGGNENDTYVFGSGYGHDRIREAQDNILSGGLDTVEFTPEIGVEDVAFSRDGDDLVITITATGDTLRIEDQYVVTETGSFGAHAFDQIERFVFADGTVMLWPDLRADIVEASQTPGDDLVLGTHFDDVFNAGAGDDRLEGGNGGDTYMFGLGDGHDVIRDNLTNLFADGADTIAFGSGITAEDIIITRYGEDNNSVTLTIAGAGDSISIENQFSYTTIGLREFEVELITFADGSSWTADDLRLQYILQAQTAGDDVVEGFWTDDVLEGGAGDDVLRGGDGSDTYVFDGGFGSDRIEEFVDNVSYDDDDTIIFGAGLLSTDAILSRSGDDVTISFSGSTDQVTIADQFEQLAYFDGWSDIESITFGDNVTWTDDDLRVQLIAQSQTSGDDHIIGFSGDDVLEGGIGNDILDGLGGADTYVFARGDGQDEINESVDTVYEDLPDTIQFAADIGSDQVEFGREGQDLVITVDGSTDSIRVNGHFGIGGYGAVELFAFGNGVTLTEAEVEALILDAQATDGDDIIEGNDSANLIIGGAGNDVLRGDDGADTYFFAPGFGHDVIQETVDRTSISDFDTVEFGSGLLMADTTLARSGEDLIITFDSGESLTVEGQFAHLAYFAGWSDVELFQFSDGSSWTDADIRELILQQSATAGDDTITGFWGADVIDGGAGDDVLQGLGGGDTYLFGPGSGHDVIQESYDTVYEDQPDRVLFAAGVDPSDITISRVGNDLVIELAGGADSLTVQNHFSSDPYQIESLVFADGTEWVGEEMLWIRGTDGPDSLSGTSQDDTLSGGSGDDALSGAAGDDQLIGGSGDDQVDGGEGYDTVVIDADSSDVRFIRQQDGSVVAVQDATGEADTLQNVEAVFFTGDSVWTSVEQLVGQHGTAGDDPAIFGSLNDDTLFGLEGDDTLIGDEGDDHLVGGVGYDQANYAGSLTDFIFQRQADGSVQVTDTVGNEGVDTLVSIEAVYFEGDQTWRTIEQVAGQYGTSGDDGWISGTTGSDNLFGLAGDDTFFGDEGDDRLDGGEGYDQANLAGNLGDYVFTRQGDGSVIAVDTVGTDGADTLVSIEAVYFEGDQTWRSVEQMVGDYGTNGDDGWIAGTVGDDQLYGLDGDDTLFGDAGDDFIYGGSGFDQVNYEGAAEDFEFIDNLDGTITVTDLVGGQGTDVLTSIEAIYFEGSQVWTPIGDLLSGGQQGQAAGSMSDPFLAQQDYLLV